jgi:AraC-like DNA-binding protein
MINGMGNRAIQSDPITVSVTLLSQMFRYLASLQVNTLGFLRSIGVDPQTLQSPDARIPAEAYLYIQDQAAEYTNDPYFGLHMGEFAEAGSWSILGYLMMNSQTVGEAIEKTDRYSRIVGDLIQTHRREQDRKIEFVFSASPLAPKMSRHCFEAAISSGVHMLGVLAGVNLVPIEVCFDSPAPATTDEYERIFRCPVYFGQTENSLTIDASILKTPILLPNSELLQYFENYANEYLAKIDQKNEFTRQVTQLILSYLDQENLTIDSIAAEMNMSVRTLQNRLSKEGVVFSELLREARVKLAQKYLREGHSVDVITYLLGFSEPSVFRKAFKKWSGVTPGEYRQQFALPANQI